MKKIKSKNIIIFAIVVLLLVVSGLLVWRHNRNSTTNTGTNPSAGYEKVDYSPASADDQARADANKDAIVKQQEGQSSQTTGTKKTVTPIIVDASQYGDQIEVRSFVPGIVESDGRCTVTFTQGGQVVTKVVTAFQDASTTQCAKLTLPRSSFTGSEKSVIVTVEYNSTTASGKSDNKTMELK